jgi:hypothetical protein
MNNSIFGYKEFLIKSIDENQILEKSFSFDENEDKAIDNINEKTIEKFNLKNKLFEEKDFYLFNYLNDNNQIKFDNLPLPDFNSSLTSTNNSKKSHFLNENNIPLNKEVKINSIYPKKEKIFKIAKTNRKIGRIKKDSLLKGKHDKLSEDNIIRKIKVRFHEKLRIYINEEYKKYLSKKYIKKRKSIVSWLKKVNPRVLLKIKKEDNMKWFETKIYEIFSEKVSSRYSTYSPDLNKQKINNLYCIGNAKNVLKILNSNIETYYYKYINDEKVEGLQTLKDDIKELEIYMKNKKQENIKEYLRKYEYIYII